MTFSVILLARLCSRRGDWISLVGTWKSKPGKQCSNCPGEIRRRILLCSFLSTFELRAIPIAKPSWELQGWIHFPRQLGDFNIHTQDVNSWHPTCVRSSVLRKIKIAHRKKQLWKDFKLWDLSFQSFWDSSFKDFVCVSCLSLPCSPGLSQNVWMHIQAFPEAIPKGIQIQRTVQDISTFPYMNSARFRNWKVN